MRKRGCFYFLEKKVFDLYWVFGGYTVVGVIFYFFSFYRLGGSRFGWVVDFARFFCFVSGGWVGVSVVGVAIFRF